MFSFGSINAYILKLNSEIWVSPAFVLHILTDALFLQDDIIKSVYSKAYNPVISD